LETLEKRFYVIAEKTASEIAKKANKCCYRTDGYEQDIERFTLNKIKDIIDLVIDNCY